jgi:hypothetical protein
VYNNEVSGLNRGNRAGRNLAIKHKSIELASYRQMTTTSTPSTGFSRVRMDSSTQECMTSAPPRFDRTEHGPVQGLSRGQISNRFVDLSLVNQSQELGISVAALFDMGVLIGLDVLEGGVIGGFCVSDCE